MRCTSSDLIIVNAAPYPRKPLQSPPSPLNALIRGRRVPKRQESVKVEAFDRLRGAGLFNVTRDDTQAQGIEQRGRRRMQERQVAEPVTQAIVAHRCLGI